MTFEEFKEMLARELEIMQKRGLNNERRYERGVGMWKMYRMLVPVDDRERDKELDEVWDIIDYWTV